jgi:hypothetical protein
MRVMPMFGMIGSMGDEGRSRHKEYNVIQSQLRTVYVERRHGPLHGPLTVLLLVWALALPAVLLLLTGLGPIGWLLGAGLAFLFGVPWIVGLVIVWFVRSLS